MKPHNYYKVPTASETGKQLQSLMAKCDEVAEIARKWAETQGASTYIESPEGIAGGIVALEFPNTIRKSGYDRVTSPDGAVYFLPEEDSDLEKEMYALPIVSETEFIAILKFKPRTNSKDKPLPYTFGKETPIVFLHNDFWYVDMPYECQAEGIIPTTEKDFYRRKMAAINTKS